MSGRAATDNVIPGQFALSVGDAEMPCPPGWTWQLLTDVARLESGHTPSRNHPEWWGGSVPWIGIKDARASHGKTIYETAENTNEDGLANSAARLLPAGTVCLSRTASVGYVVVMGKEMATSQDFVNWICTEAVVPDFLKYLFIAEKESLLRFSKGTTHSTIYFPEVKAFRVCLPSPTQQKRIVAKIEALQARSDAAKQALDAIPPLLEKLRQSVLAAAFRGDLTKAWREAHPDVEPASKLLERIRAERRRKWKEANPKKKYVEPEPVDADGLPELPRGWCWASAAEIVEPSADIVYGIVQPGPPLANGVPYVRGIDIRDDKILVDQLWQTSHEIAAKYRRSAIRTGDVLLCIIRHLKVAVVPATLDGGNLSRTTARLRPSSAITTDYLADALRSPFCQGWLKANYRGGTSMPKVNIGDVVRLPIPLAPVEEQRSVSASIASLFGNFRRLVDATQAASVVHASLTQSILSKAFRGELVPQDPTDEPASALLERIRAAREATAQPKRSTKRPRKPKAAQ